MRDIHELDSWIKEHPVLAQVYCIGIVLLFLELLGIADQLLHLWLKGAGR